MNTDGSNQHLLSPASTSMHDYAPSLNSAGTRIAYTSNTNTTATGPQLFVMNADGTGTTQLTSSYDGSTSSYPAWSPDGQHIAYLHSSGQVTDVWMAARRGDKFAGQAGRYAVGTTRGPVLVQARGHTNGEFGQVVTNVAGIGD